MIQEPDQFISVNAHDRPAAQYLNALFEYAALNGVADVHMQWTSGILSTRLRDGSTLRQYESPVNLDAHLSKLIDEKLRSRANFSQSERSKPIDGRIRLKFPANTIDLRVSLVPTVNGGQKIVCRLLDQANGSKDLNTIEMTPMVRRTLDELMFAPQGLILVCGPTGSGKTTTLYGMLGELNDGTRNICAAENPVEYILQDATQVNIDQHTTFPMALRAFLRQDPDVILIGEIRDHETAMIAIEAANTGHLVLATVHANSSALGVTRLVDLGVDPYSLAACLVGVIAQRLVRKLDDSTPFTWGGVTEADLIWLKKHRMDNVSERFPVHKGSKFKGKLPVMEVMRMDSMVRKAILAEEGEMGILNASAYQPQFETLAQAGVRLASEGKTSFTEIKSAVGDDTSAPQAKRLGDVLMATGALSFEQMLQTVQRQQDLKAEGRIVKFGDLLLEQGFSPIKLIEAIGHTDRSAELLKPYLDTGRLKRADLNAAMAKWKASHNQGSFFDVIIEMQLLTKDEIYAPEIVFSSGSLNRIDNSPVASPRAGTRERRDAELAVS